MKKISFVNKKKGQRLTKTEDKVGKAKNRERGKKGRKKNFY